jgi:hypothetical protein
MVGGVLEEHLRIEHLVLRPADRPEHDARPELAGERQILLAKDLLHERLLIVRVIDDEPAADPDRLAVLAQDPGAQRVERSGHHVAAALADQADDALPKLGRSPVGERDGEDLPGRDVLDADEIGDPVGQDAGLARSGAGEDQQRPIGGRDCPRLLGVERADDLLGTGRTRGRDGSRIRRAGTGFLLGDTTRVAQPGGFLGGDRGLREVGERGPDGLPWLVEGSFGRSSTASGAHRSIVGARLVGGAPSEAPDVAEALALRSTA